MSQYNSFSLYPRQAVSCGRAPETGILPPQPPSAQAEPEMPLRLAYLANQALYLDTLLEAGLSCVSRVGPAPDVSQLDGRYLNQSGPHTHA